MACFGNDAAGGVFLERAVRGALAHVFGVAVIGGHHQRAASRGDTCVGSYVAARLECPPEEAILWSAATTSLKIETPGPISRPYEDIVDLIEQKYKGAYSPS